MSSQAGSAFAAVAVRTGAMSENQTTAESPGGDDAARRASLTRREREILGLLADGMSGAQIAAKLVLSPETVRTHVRNAMAKLGASTRSQAVVLAMQQDVPAEAPTDTTGGPTGARASAQGISASSPGVSEALTGMLNGLVGLYDVNGGAIYVADEDGLSLRRMAVAGEADLGFPESVALGDGALGRAALDRRAQLLQDRTLAGGAVIAAPMVGAGRLLGVIALAPRISRPIGRSELLLLQAFATRVGEVLVSGGDVTRRLDRAMDRFRTSWSAAIRVG
jgi:DNA-binding CsgD family transcriptional regulator